MPSFLTGQPRSITQQGFSEQWQLRRTDSFEHKTLFGFSIEDYVNHVKYAFAVNDLQSWDIKAFLDAGCGSGEMTLALAAQMPEVQVVGFDLSDSVYATFDMATRLHNCHFVQGDITRNPWRPGSFDAVFSSGVLHCLPDPEQGFRSLWKLCCRTMYFWVYPAYQFCVYDWIRDRVVIGHRLPRLARKALSWAVAPFIWCFSALTGTYHYSKQKLDSVSTIAFCMFDSFTPEFQFRQERADVLGWVHRADNAEGEIINDLGVRVKRVQR